MKRKYKIKTIDGIVYKKCTYYLCENPWKKLETEFYTRGKGKYHSCCKECQKLKTKQYQTKNKEKCKQWQKTANEKRNHSKEWKMNNQDKVKQHRKNDYEKNKDRFNAYNAEKRGYKRKATPEWADRKELRIAHKEAIRLTELTGIQYSVDHIIPYKATNKNGKQVACGLNVINNLCIMPLEINIKKNYNFEPIIESQKNFE